MITPSRAPSDLGLLRITNKISPIDSRLFGGTAVVVADTAYLVHFRVNVATPVTAMEYYCGAAAGNVDLGVFSTVDFAAFTLVASTGLTLAAGASAIQSINLTTAPVLVPGLDYFAAVVGNNAGLTIARFVPVAAIVGNERAAFQKAALDPLASFSTPTNTAYLPYLTVK